MRKNYKECPFCQKAVVGAIKNGRYGDYVQCRPHSAWTALCHHVPGEEGEDLNIAVWTLVDDRTPRLVSRPSTGEICLGIGPIAIYVATKQGNWAILWGHHIIKYHYVASVLAKLRAEEAKKEEDYQSRCHPENYDEDLFDKRNPEEDAKDKEELKKIKPYLEE